MDRNMRLAPEDGDMDAMEAHLRSISGEQLYVYEAIDAMRYVVQQDESRTVQVLVRWAGFPLSESSWEDPIRAGLCAADDLDNYIAGLLDLSVEFDSGRNCLFGIHFNALLTLTWQTWSSR